jgi:spore photoproduct lyase
MFVPTGVYYEKNAENYPLGAELLCRYRNLGVPCIEIENHNNIEFMRKRPNSEFGRMKRNLVLGVRKSLKYVPNFKTSDFLVPYTSSGCIAKCLYCYLVCHYNKCAYLRIFVNREQMMEKLIATTNGSAKPLTFEIGSNSDLVLENTITGNLEWTIEKFSHARQGFITLPTKFSFVEPLLGLSHKGRTIIRMSLNPESIIRQVELGTSSLKARLLALNRLKSAGYGIGVLIAPVIMLPGWQQLYGEMIEYAESVLVDQVKKELSFEIIFMTYSNVHRIINRDAFPGAVELYDSKSMTFRGRRKYAYRRDLREKGEAFLRETVTKYFPKSRICYVV